MSQPRDSTFRAFNKDQGANYAAYRLNYHPNLYKKILEYHTADGSALGTLLDVGTGPGLAVGSLAPHFDHAIGLDASTGMIETARSLGGATRTGEKIRFEVAIAEDLGSSLDPPVVEGSINLITAATAAHWFDMTKFWPQAAKMLKPGGSVAIWTTCNIRVAPSVPNRERVQAAIDLLEERLTPWLTEGNILTRNLYREIPLPWTLIEPVTTFGKTTYARLEWDVDSSSQPSDELFAQQPGPLNLETVEQMIGTSSPVVRWREEHPQLTGTEEDLVRRMRREVESALHDAGVEEGKELIEGFAQGVLLLVKKIK